MTIAKVKILQKRTAEKVIIIEVDVEIKGIIERKRYIVSEGLTNTEVKQYITDKIIEEEKRDVVGEKFEVEI